MSKMNINNQYAQSNVVSEVTCKVTEIYFDKIVKV